MTPDLVVKLAMDAGWLCLYLGGPILLGGLVTGLGVSVFQAVTQIQDATLTFIPKLVVTLIVLAVLGHWMLDRILGFTTNLLVSLPAYAR